MNVRRALPPCAGPDPTPPDGRWLSRDVRTFTPVADVTFPEGMRHGTACIVSRVTADAPHP